MSLARYTMIIKKNRT